MKTASRDNEKVKPSSITNHGAAEQMAAEKMCDKLAWKTKRESSNGIVITPCEPIPLRLMEVRIPWEPSSFVEENERKNVFLELRDDTVRAFLQAQEDELAEEWGCVNSCLAKQGLLRCKLHAKQVRVYDESKLATEAPQQWSGWVVNALVKLIGKWQTSDGSATGLNLQATDVQLLRPYQRLCRF